MDEFNIDLSEVEKAQEQAAEQAEVVNPDSGLSAGHKVLFYIFLGIVGLSGVGIPILVVMLLKERKKRKAAEDALNAPKEEEKPEPASEEKKEESKPDKAETPKK